MKNKRLQIIWRYGIVSLIISVIALLIVSSAVRTTLINADKWNAKTDSLLSRVYLVHPKRGEILASDGSVLATNLTTYTICMDYRTSAKREDKFIAALDSLSDSLALYYPIRTAQEWKAYLAKPLKDAPKERKQYHVLLKDVNYTDYQRILRFPFFHLYKKKYKHGLYYTTREMRVMPFGSMARRSIGRCNYVQVPKYEGAHSRSDSADALHGYSGLEAALDSILYGQAGTAKNVQLTQSVSSWVDRPAKDGCTVKTTIDINMQDIVENELQSMLQLTKADWGTCLLMEVSTGDIKAISNLCRDDDGSYIEAMNYALQAYEPGSVMKPISMLVALEDGYAFPLERTYPIGHSYAYGGGSPISDTHSPAFLPVSRFIEYSSNIGMTRLIAPHYEDNLNGFRERLRDLGFFEKFNTGMAGERTPYFPTLDPKAGGKVSLSRMAYGYATMIPPLYTCAVYNAIANDGKYVRPRMVKEVVHPSGKVEERPVSYVRDSICSRRNAQILREMIYGVVYGEGGTAKTLRSDIVTVVGKTGTCRIANEVKKEKYDNKKSLDSARAVVRGYKEGQYRLAFCGFYPYENPKYTCMVLISNPSPEYKGAATTSGTVVKNIALKMYARGMFDNNSELRREEDAIVDPVHYAHAPGSDDKAVGNYQKSMSKVTGNKKKNHFKNPKVSTPGNTPDVGGLSIRDAVARLEDAGYNIKIEGTGYAVTQTPQPGTPLAAGSTVNVRFTSR